MKIFLCVVLLLNIGLNHASDSYWPGNNYYVNLDREYRPRPFYYDNDDHVSHHIRDDHDSDHDSDHIVRPCSTHDLNCIRHFLAHNVGCSLNYEHPKGPFIVKQLTMDIPLANVSITINNAELPNLHRGKIEEFHIDKKTDTLVLEATFDRFIVHSPRSVVTYYRAGKTPVEAADMSEIEFRRISYTWTIRNMHDPHRATSRVFAHLGDQTIPFKSGPGLNDNGLEWVNKIWIDRMPMTVREAMIAQAPAFFDAFLQTKLCKLPRGIISV